MGERGAGSGSKQFEEAAAKAAVTDFNIPTSFLPLTCAAAAAAHLGK